MEHPLKNRYVRDSFYFMLGGVLALGVSNFVFNQYLRDLQKSFLKQPSIPSAMYRTSEGDLVVEFSLPVQDKKNVFVSDCRSCHESGLEDLFARN